MKLTSTLCLALLLSATGLAQAQTASMNHDAMPGMQHGDMKAADDAPKDDKPNATHRSTALVKAVNPAKGSAMLAHEAIPELHLPAMTMAFVVKNKALFGQLPVGKTVHIEFIKQGRDFVLTAVRP